MVGLRTAALVAAALLTASPARAACDAALRPQVDAIFASFDRGVAPGAVVGVVCNGRLVLQAAYGHADLDTRRRNTPDTAFHLASVGKQMTAVAILLLQEDGVLALDDAVTRHLPELGAFASAVTLRHLLQHTSGMPDTYSRLESRGGTPTNADAVAILAEWRRLDFTPGTRQDYSNTGYDLLGSVVERVSGQPFGTFMQRRIFAPAGMASTFAFVDARWDSALRARGYERESSRFVLDDASGLNGIHGSGSVVTTVPDLARYEQAVFTDGLLQASSIAALFQPTHLANGRTIPYGLGWDLGTYNGRAWVGHSGAWMGFGSYYLRYRDDGVVVFVLANDASADTEQLADDVANVFLR